MAKRKEIHAIPKEEVRVLLARRLVNGVTELSRGQADDVAAFLLDSRMVTVGTMFADGAVVPQDAGVEK